MLKQFFELIRGFLILTHDVQENRKEIEDLRREMDKMQDKLHQLALLFQQERAERDKLTLQLENVLLRFERRLCRPTFQARVTAWRQSLREPDSRACHVSRHC